LLVLSLIGLPGAGRAADAPRLLLLPVVVHSAEDPEYLRDGLADMLSARFDRIGALELVRPAAGARGTSDPERALALARKAGVDFVLFGSFTRFGQGASLDVQCLPVSPAGAQREPLREIFVHSGSIGEIIPDLDELAGKVSRFARGEAVVESAGPGAVPAPSVAPASVVDDAALGDLIVRIEALESALTELLERDMEAGTEAELR
jgi:hypothetical protein